MSRNNFLLSLLANNPNSRSNSAISKQGPSPSMSFYPRSTSNSLSKVQKTQTSKIQTSTHLIKFTHILNIKVKQNYYFAFCRLQQLFKTNRRERSDNQQSASQPPTLSSLESIDNTKLIKQDLISQQRQQDQQKTANIVKTLTKLCDCHSSLTTKMRAMLEIIELNSSFRMIKSFSMKRISLQKVQKILNLYKMSTYQQFIDSYAQLQSLRMKSQILVSSLSQFANKRKLSYFYSIKSYQPSTQHRQDKTINSQTKHQLKIQSLPFQAANIDSSAVTDRSKDQTHSINEKTNKCIKLKLKEKNTSIIKPIKLQQLGKFAKSLKHKLSQPAQITISEQVHQQNNENKSILINLQNEHLNNPLPDFVDNCSIFRSLPEILQIAFNKKAKLNTETAFALGLQQRKSVQMLPTDDGSLTDRAKVCSPLAQSNTIRAVTSKHNSLGKIKAKKVIVVDQSPLQKVQQLFKSVQQFQSISGANKQKKFININLPKFFNSQNEKIHANKTPLKQLYQQINISHSREKQNTTKQRLLTERDKQKMEKGNLDQTGGKYKSTMLTRQKKVKTDKIQLSTARKMKMEIQNIISRRNKQLGMRNQLYQLK